jgi:hypothetical protein
LTCRFFFFFFFSSTPARQLLNNTKRELETIFENSSIVPTFSNSIDSLKNGNGINGRRELGQWRRRRFDRGQSSDRDRRLLARCRSDRSCSYIDSSTIIHVSILRPDEDGLVSGRAVSCRFADNTAIQLLSSRFSIFRQIDSNGQFHLNFTLSARCLVSFASPREPDTFFSWGPRSPFIFAVSISAVEPPMICVAQRTNVITVTGDTFVRYNDESIDGEPATGGAARCWTNVIDADADLKAANDSVQGQGKYSKTGSGRDRGEPRGPTVRGVPFPWAVQRERGESRVRRLHAGASKRRRGDEHHMGRMRRRRDSTRLDNSGRERNV